MGFYTAISLIIFIFLSNVTSSENSKDFVTEVPPDNIPEEPGGFDTAEALETTLAPLLLQNQQNHENETVWSSETFDEQIMTNDSHYIDFENTENFSHEESEYLAYNLTSRDNIKYATENFSDNFKEPMNFTEKIVQPVNTTETILQNHETSENNQTLDKGKNIKFKKPAEIFEDILNDEDKYDEVCGFTPITWLLNKAKESGVQFPGDCWNYLCLKVPPTVMQQKFDGTRVIWWYTERLECYEALPVNTRNTSLYYKIVDVVEGVQLFFLRPDCSQMIGSVNVFLSLHYSPWGLPVSCQEEVCLEGYEELHFESVNTNLVTHMKSNDNKLRDKCFDDLYKKLGDSSDVYGMNSTMTCRDIKQRNTNNHDQNVKYCYSENYPESSPCKTMYAIRNDSHHYQVIIPIRTGNCSSLNENGWFELLHSYFSTLHNSDLHENLHMCLLRKGHGMEYFNNKYQHLLNDMLGPNLVFPNISKSCVNFLCNPAIHISSSNRLKELSNCMDFRNNPWTCNKNTTWFTYINECSDNCDQHNTMSNQCYNSNGNNHYSLVDSVENSTKSSILSPILKSSCPGGSGAGEQGRQRAEVLNVLWNIGDNIAQACMVLVCNGSIQLLDDHYIDTVYLPLDFNLTLMEDCLTQLNEKNTYNDSFNKIFSFGDRVSSREVVFVMSNDKSKVEYLALAFSHRHLDLIPCCNEPADITSNTRIHFKHATVCFTSKFYSQETTVCRPNNSSNWYKEVELTENVKLLLIDKGDRVIDILQWMASLGVSLSKENIAFIKNASYGLHDFRSAKIFSLKEPKESIKLMKLKVSLIASSFHCSSDNDFFTLCYNQAMAKGDTVIYMFFFHNCEINVHDKNGIDLLFLSKMRGKTGVNITALCQEESIVAGVTRKSSKVSYTTSGHQTSKVLHALQEAAPSFTWQADFVNTLNKKVRYRECFPLKHLQMLPRVLDRGECVIYSKNNATYIMNPALENEDFTFRFTVETHKVKATEYETDLRTFYQDSAEKSFNLLEQIRNKQLGNSMDFDTASIYNFTLQRMGNHPPRRFFYIHMKIPINVREEIFNHSFQDLVYKSIERIPLESNSLQKIKDDMNPDTAKLNIQANMNVILNSYVKHDLHCVSLLANKSFIVNHFGKQLILVGPISNDLVQNSCFDSLPEELWDDLKKLEKINKTTINKFWPGCLHNMIIGTSLKVNVIDWWYLDSVCKFIQVTLLILSMVVTLVIIAGNIFVLLFIWKSGKWREGHIMVRASLAVADLLVGLLPAMLAVCDHVSLMNGSLTLQHLAPDTILESFQKLRRLQAPGFQQLRFEREGYPMFCSMVLSTSVFVSILTLALLSIERLCAMTRSVLKNRYVVFGVSTSWILGILLTILVNLRQNGWKFIGYFDPVTKLTTSIGSCDSSVSQDVCDSSFSHVVFYILVTIVSVASLTIIVFTTSTIILLHADFCYSNRYLPGIRDRDVKQTTLTSLYMVGLFILSCIPAALDFGLNLDITSPLGHFLCWWLFIAGSAWNWTLYTLRGDLRNYGQILCGTKRRLRSRSEVTHESYVASEDNISYISGTKVKENGHRVEELDLNTIHISASAKGL